MEGVARRRLTPCEPALCGIQAVVLGFRSPRFTVDSLQPRVHTFGFISAITRRDGVVRTRHDILQTIVRCFVWCA